ncbi:alpha/beta hydrolase [Stemphylium lycopersici]|uniref:Alpha/beta hydrolase n=1 Tax=Stemphylium lycopersici TaxID=183478 RepID=A0A364MUA4_STELY|nr:alpha beta hydrolase [Stemphylium lycopersici]RAQ99984.1 alpha/beta hydrolase [Stemphylium lycopersici]RAR03754.1 alpha/beta hydrolase [Stemphylium lycopersici]
MPCFSQSDDLKIFYTLHGELSNPPLVLIHGWTCDSLDWSFTIPALIQKYYVIVFDLRGHGHSSAPESITYTIKDFAEDAVALLQHVSITKGVLVMGHSVGGVVASAITALHPDIFRGLVAIAEHVVDKILQGAYAPGMLGQQETHAHLVKDREIPQLAVYMTEENVEDEKSLGVGADDEIVQLADAGHWLRHIKPDEFNAILTKWLERTEAAKA